MSLEHLLHTRLCALSTFMSNIALGAVYTLKSMLISPKTSREARVAREDFMEGGVGTKERALNP